MLGLLVRVLSFVLSASTIRTLGARLLNKGGYMVVDTQSSRFIGIEGMRTLGVHMAIIDDWGDICPICGAVSCSTCPDPYWKCATCGLAYGEDICVCPECAPSLSAWVLSWHR